MYYVEQFDHDSSHVVAAFYKEEDAKKAADKLQIEDEKEERRYNEWVRNDDDENDYDGTAVFGYSYTCRSIEVK